MLTQNFTEIFGGFNISSYLCSDYDKTKRKIETTGESR